MNKRPPDRVALGVAALRRLTDDDGPIAAVTRARLLARSPGQGRRRLVTVALGLGAAAIVSGGVAATLVRAAREDAPSLPVPTLVVKPARPPVVVRSLPASELPPVEAAEVPAPDAELASYGAAHRAHFVAKTPVAALRLWSAYLARYPRGRLVPEATYNRALALIRLGRRPQAIAALRPIAAGQFGDYRRHEAEALIGALAGESGSNASD